MSPSNDTVAAAYLREAIAQLEKAAGAIRHCLEQLADEQLAWRPGESMNSVGNLILHLCGNVGQWILAGVGEGVDRRDRPEEFSAAGPFHRGDLCRRLDQLLGQARDTISSVPAAKLLEQCRIQGFETTHLAAIFDSVAHFKGHAQEIVCLTRMQLGDSYHFQWTPSTPEEGAPPSP